jgi:hypothetical protein
VPIDRKPAELPYRPEEAIDKAVGKRRNAQQVGTAFFSWPLWRHYRTWVQHLDDVAERREKDKK